LVNIHHRAQLIHIRLAAGARQDALVRHGVHLADIAREDTVPRAETRISGKYAVSGTCNGRDGTTVKVIGREAMLNGRLAVIGIGASLAGQDFVVSLDGLLGKDRTFRAFHQWRHVCKGAIHLD
jgi:hypothetical protein